MTFSSANTYIHLGYASAPNWNVAMREDDEASASSTVWKRGSCSHRGVTRTSAMFTGLRFSSIHYVTCSHCNDRVMTRKNAELVSLQWQCPAGFQLYIYFVLVNLPLLTGRLVKSLNGFIMKMIIDCRVLAEWWIQAENWLEMYRVWSSFQEKILT